MIYAILHYGGCAIILGLVAYVGIGCAVRAFHDMTTWLE